VTATRHTLDDCLLITAKKQAPFSGETPIRCARFAGPIDLLSFVTIPLSHQKLNRTRYMTELGNIVKIKPSKVCVSRQLRAKGEAIQFGSPHRYRHGAPAPRNDETDGAHQHGEAPAISPSIDAGKAR
jgi:hypothetical protein